MELTKSVEDYLETILMVKLTRGVCKAINIAEHLEVSKPAVTKAINFLITKGYVIKDGTKIELTDIGQAYAEKCYEKHLTIKALLLRLGVSEEDAEKDCCRIEHCITENTFNALKKHLEEL